MSALILLAAHLSCGQTKTRVHVTFTNSYCGGARPTPEIEQESKTPIDLSKTSLLLAGKSQVKVKTDSAGWFTAPLKPGTYQVRMTKVKPAGYVTNYDPACKKMLKATYAELIVTKGVYQYELNLHFRCNPCELPRP